MWSTWWLVAFEHGAPAREVDEWSGLGPCSAGNGDLGGAGFWRRLVAYSGSMLVPRPCWAAICFNFCNVFWFCVFFYSILLALLVVGVVIVHTSVVCLVHVMPCWWFLSFLGGDSFLGWWQGRPWRN